MHLKRYIASLLACTMLAGNAALPCFAADNGIDASMLPATLDLSALANGNFNISQNSDGSYSFSIGGKEWTFGLDQKDTVKMTGIVNVRSGSCLRLREGPSTSTKILDSLAPGTQVEVLSKEGDWYKVTYKDKSGYMHGDYLQVTETTIQENSGNEELFTMLLALLLQGQQTSTPVTGLTPPGNMTLLDDLGIRNGQGQQFITLVTKAGNTFYLVIDRDDDGNENVHFLNLVDELDLFALLDDDAKQHYEEQQRPVETEPLPTVPPPTTEPVPQVTPERKTNTAPLALLAVLGLGGAGFLGYSFLNKKKQGDTSTTPDPDADYADDEEEYDFPEESEEAESGDDYEIPEDVTDDL